MSLVEPLKTSSLIVYPLSSPSSRQALSVFAQLLSSCAGPNGKNHIIRNACGGHLSVTSTCSRLLSSISLSRSELKLVASSITGHLQQNKDCGLFMAHVCLQLTKSSLDVDLPHSTVTSVFQSFVSIIVDYMKSENTEIRLKADLSNVELLLAYARSIFNSKSLLNIRSQDITNFSLTILNAFVSAIPSAPVTRCSNGVFVLGHEKLQIKNSKYLDGLLLEVPGLSTPGNFIELITNLKLTHGIESESYLKVALITCSVSGDIDDMVTATYEGTDEQFTEVEQGIVQNIISLCDTLEKEKVAIILCQKVIHPKVKDILSSKRMLFVDRLGSQPIPYVRDLTGCQPITSILQSVEGDKYLGRLSSISSYSENDKEYLWLKNCNANIVTLIVCADWEERLSELKQCVSTCLHGLESLVREPHLLMGGGCWQMHCSQILNETVLSTLTEMSRELSCKEATLRQLLKLFRFCLHRWCFNLKHDFEHLLFDPASKHCWRVSKSIPVSMSVDKMKPCCCGLKVLPSECLENLDIVMTNDTSYINEGNCKSHYTEAMQSEGYDYVVLDNFTSCIKSLQNGTLTAGLLLSIGQFICDKN